MRVKDILKVESDVVTIDANQTIHEAICKLNEHRIGALVVTDSNAANAGADPGTSHSHLRYSWGGTTASAIVSNQICGVITERDIMRECGEHCTHLSKPSEHGEGPCPALVKDVMTTDKDLIIGVPDDHLDYVMRVMTKRGVRHLPILDGAELAGMLSIGDVMNAHLTMLHTDVDTKEFEIRMLQDYVQGRMY
ncbi:MAG: CBS domain-containing protein [Gemmatimonadales bacterium]|nr:CBS domain-containing protein [Gemmatimonadales bacterium]